MEQFPKFLASRLARQQRRVETHPEADALTAFAENRLRPAERKPLLAHLAICAECREVVALVFGETAEESRTASANRAFNWATLRLVAGLAAVFLLVVTVVRHPASTAHSEISREPASAPAAAAALPAKANTTMTPRSKKPASRPRIIGPQQPVPPPIVPTAPLTAHLPVESAAKKVLPSPSQQPVPPTISTAPITAPLPIDATIPRALPPRPSTPAPQSTGVSLGLLPRGEFARAIGGSLKRQSLWNIDANPGVLRRSDDGGRTWSSVTVHSQTDLLALSVSGGDIWTGGQAGALFHSTDNGLHWNQVTVWDGAERLGDAITAIETHGPQVVRIRTKSGDWVSSDGGGSWTKE